MPEERASTGEDEKTSLYGDRTVAGEYEKNKSIQAQARKKRRAQKKSILERVASSTGYDQYLLEQLSLMRELGAKEAAKQTLKNVAQRILLKRISPWLYAISLTVCFWQFVFAAISLAGYTFHAFSLYTLQETTLGKITEFTLGWLIDLESWLPGQYIGGGFWILVLLLGMGGFISFMLFFHLMGIQLMRSVLSTLILALCIALTILPVSNLFPWLTLWIWYIIRSETSLFSMALEHHKTKHETAEA